MKDEGSQISEKQKNISGIAAIIWLTSCYLVTVWMISCYLVTVWLIFCYLVTAGWYSVFCHYLDDKSHYLDDLSCHCLADTLPACHYLADILSNCQLFFIERHYKSWDIVFVLLCSAVRRKKKKTEGKRLIFSSDDKRLMAKKKTKIWNGDCQDRTKKWSSNPHKLSTLTLLDEHARVTINWLCDYKLVQVFSCNNT